jgi:hypothetical protein
MTKSLNLYFSKSNKFNHPEFYCCENSNEYIQLVKYNNSIQKNGYSNNPLYVTKKYVNITFNRNNLTNDLTPKTLYTVEYKTINTVNNDKKYINFRIHKILPVAKVVNQLDEVEVDLSDTD